MSADKKKFHIPAEKIEQLVPNLGGCIATDRIVVDGCPVGTMTRQDPVDEVDSGWLMTAGDESDTYMAEPNNLAVYAVNTLVNYDPSIIGFLNYPVGTYITLKNGELVVEEGPKAPPKIQFMMPLTEGLYQFAESMAFVVPCRLLRRMDNGSMVLWRQGLTVWLDLFGRREKVSGAEEIDRYLETASTDRFDVKRIEKNGLESVSYRLDEKSGDRVQKALYGTAVSDIQRVIAGIYFDDEDAQQDAEALWGSLHKC